MSRKKKNYTNTVDCKPNKLSIKTRRYAGLLLSPAEGFGFQPRFLFTFGNEEERDFFFFTLTVIFGT